MKLRHIDLNIVCHFQGESWRVVHYCNSTTFLQLLKGEVTVSASLPSAGTVYTTVYTTHQYTQFTHQTPSR